MAIAGRKIVITSLFISSFSMFRNLTKLINSREKYLALLGGSVTS